MLRVAGPEDADALVAFNTKVFDERITDWSADLLSGRHPTVQAGDFTIVEDTRHEKIVSSLCLISQTWQYDGISFPVGRVDLVATDPEYRRRGLIRKQFDAIHARSEAKGELMQVIAGVDWFYRQFGYDMGVKRWGSRCIDALHLSALKGKDADRYRLRKADAGDQAFIREVYEESIRSQLYAGLRTDEEWEMEFTGRSKGNTRGRAWLVIEDVSGTRLGYVQYLPCIAVPSMPVFRVYQVELRSGECYLNLTPFLMAGLWEMALAMHADGDLVCEKLQGLELALERDHSLYHTISKAWLSELKPSPWYIRVPDMVALLRRIKPALEKHLLGTLAEGYSGELKLNFYRSGLRMAFERGRITTLESWKPTEVWEGDAKFPDSTFLRLVCGWSRFHELSGCFPDCSGRQEAALLLDILFPSFSGKVWMLA